MTVYFQMYKTMDTELANEIIACLPKGRTRFDYFRDRYAAMLLGWKAGRGVSVAEVKQSRFSGLLDKTLIRELLARSGQKTLNADSLSLAWQEPAMPYVLSLALWDGKKSWAQTSRKGVNLVLQMNFSNLHREAFLKLVKPVERDIFLRYGHPVRSFESGRDTMAWARLDLDLDTGEAVIEEIQNDWLRSVHEDYRWMGRFNMLPWYSESSGQAFAEYYEDVIKPYLKQWDEAMLAATLWFLREEIGIHRVWFHDFRTGQVVKKVGDELPPRSLYTKLPRRFCFRKISESPEFLKRDAGFRRRWKKVPEPSWNYLEV